MKSGDTFVLDAQAVEEAAKLAGQTAADLAGKVDAGDTYGVSKSASLDSDVIHASKWEEKDGALKPRRGRPRAFPRGTVFRLLGEEDTRPAVPAPKAEAADEVAEEDLDAVADEVLNEDPTDGELPAEVLSKGKAVDSW